MVFTEEEVKKHICPYARESDSDDIHDILNEHERVFGRMWNVSHFFGQLIVDMGWRAGDKNTPKYSYKGYKTNFRSKEGTIITVSFDHYENKFDFKERSDHDYYSQLF